MRYDTQRFLFVPSILLFIHFSSLSSSLSLWQLTSSFAYHGHSSSSSPPLPLPLPRLWLHLSRARAAEAASFLHIPILFPTLSAVCIPVTCPAKVIWPTFLSAALWDISALRPVFWRAICTPSSLCWLLGGQPLSTLFFFFFAFFFFALTE